MNLIRPFRSEDPVDDSALWAMLAPVFRAGDTYAVDRDISRADAIAFWTGPPHDAFLHDDGGVIRGSYYIQPNQQGGGAHVCNCGFVTDPASAGRGVARAMLNHALAEARTRGYAAMQFNFVVETNDRAVRTWEANGFDVVGRLPGAFRHPEQGEVDALVMYRRL